MSNHKILKYILWSIGILGAVIGIFVSITHPGIGSIILGGAATSIGASTYL